MTYEEAIGFIEGKLNCMKKCAEFYKEYTCSVECDNCKYAYTQGNFGEQLVAFELAVNTLNDVHYLSQQQLDIQLLKSYVDNDTTLYDLLKAHIKVLKRKPINYKQFTDFDNKPYAAQWTCPSCGQYHLNGSIKPYCDNCGQAIDWD